MAPCGSPFQNEERRLSFGTLLLESNVYVWTKNLSWTISSLELPVHIEDAQQWRPLPTIHPCFNDHYHLPHLGIIPDVSMTLTFAVAFPLMRAKLGLTLYRRGAVVLIYVWEESPVHRLSWIGGVLYLIGHCLLWDIGKSECADTLLIFLPRELKHDPRTNEKKIIYACIKLKIHETRGKQEPEMPEACTSVSMELLKWAVS